MVFLIYLLLGAAAGLLAGLFGVGGGIIIVPALIFSFSALGFDSSVLTHMAVGTSLATILFTSINAVREHHRHGAVRWQLFVWLTLGIVFGSVLGAITADAIDGQLLQKIIGIFALCIALQLGLDLKPKAQGQVPGKTGLGLAGSVIGWASAIIGIGGGSLTVPFLTWRGVAVQQAVATSSACGWPIAAAGALTYLWLGRDDSRLPDWSLGYVYLPSLLGIALTSVFSARSGARLAHRLSPRTLKRLFALLLLAVGLNFLL